MTDIKDNYTFVSKKGDTWANVCIIEGKFKDVIYNYGKVSINPEKENDDGSLPFRFEYTIIDNALLQREEFGEEFFILIGDILVDIIDDQLKEQTLELVNSKYPK